MPAYLLPRDGATPPTIPALTLAAPRATDHPSAAHAIIGDPVMIDLAREGALPRQRLATRRCILRARLVLDDVGVVRVIDLRYRDRDAFADEADRIARVIRNSERGMAGDPVAANDQLAQLAGFTDFAAMFAWHSHKERRARPSHQGQVERELIAWSAS